jgi:5-methylcytosine-specific restriction protein A
MGKPKSWDVEEVRAKLQHDQGPAAFRIVKDFEQRLESKYSDTAVTIQWRGSSLRKDEHATLWPWIEYEGVFYYPPVCLRVDGKVEVPFWPKGTVPSNRNTKHDRDTIRTPFIEEKKRRKLRDLLDEIPGIDLKPGNPNGLRSTFDLFLLEDRETFDKLVEVFDWCVNETVTGTVRLPSEAIEAKVGSDLDSLQAEEEYFEGQKRQRFTNYYERNQKLRAAAVKHHDVSCKVCGFNFGEAYGERGKDYIEVHHLIPVSTLGEEASVDPKSDMTVLCSNCHRMIHRRKDHVLMPEELRRLLPK